MEFSLFFFADDAMDATLGARGRYRLLLDAARFADAHDFTAVWTPERHFHPFGGLYPNPAVTGAAVAAVTGRVGIRAGSVVAPLQDPLRIAEEWSTVDNLSGGRAAVSFASGWHPYDFVLAPDEFERRRDGAVRAMETVRTLWSGGTVTRPNGVGDEVEVRIYPPPVQPALPMWLTSAGTPDTFRAAGAAGAGVLTHLVKQGVDSLADNIRAYRESFRQQCPSMPAPGTVTLMVHTLVAPDDEAAEVARDPLRRYVAGSMGLFGTGAATPRPAGRPLPAGMRERLIDLAVDRYLTTAGLIGSIDSAIATVERFRAAGVDELACLLDFGVPADDVISSLKHLDVVRRTTCGS